MYLYKYNILKTKLGTKIDTNLLWETYIMYMCIYMGKYNNIKMKVLIQICITAVLHVLVSQAVVVGRPVQGEEKATGWYCSKLKGGWGMKDIFSL